MQGSPSTFTLLAHLQYLFFVFHLFYFFNFCVSVMWWIKATYKDWAQIADITLSSGFDCLNSLISSSCSVVCISHSWAMKAPELFELCTVSKRDFVAAVWVYLWLWHDAMCPCLAGVGWSRERAMPEGLHLPFGSRAWCLLDPLRAAPSHWIIWQLGCDHRRRDRWAVTLLSVGLMNIMPHDKPH